jgi:hypothetical protein
MTRGRQAYWIVFLPLIIIATGILFAEAEKVKSVSSIVDEQVMAAEQVAPVLAMTSPVQPPASTTPAADSVADPIASIVPPRPRVGRSGYAPDRPVQGKLYTNRDLSTLRPSAETRQIWRDQVVRFGGPRLSYTPLCAPGVSRDHGWYDDPKQNGKGKIHANLLVRQSRVVRRHPCVPPGSYEFPFGTLTVHPGR